MIQNSSTTVPTTPPPRDGEFRAGAVSDWLTGEARMVGGPRAQLEGFCRQLLAAGLPLYRASFNLQTLHPLLRAQSFVWDRATDIAEAFDHDRAVDDTPSYLSSPVAAIHNGAGGVRCRLDADPPQLDYPLMHDLKAEGVTDYVMMPITFSDGALNAISWATDRPGGFTTSELGEVYSLLPVLALLIEVAVARKIANNVLDTYIGRDAARRVLAGDITRGSGETISAALWYCDMRGFTVMTEALPRDEVLATLNDYFECMGRRRARPWRFGAQVHGRRHAGNFRLRRCAGLRRRVLGATRRGRRPRGAGHAQHDPRGRRQDGAGNRARTSFRRCHVRQYRRRRPARLHGHRPGRQRGGARRAGLP